MPNNFIIFSPSRFFSSPSLHPRQLRDVHMDVSTLIAQKRAHEARWIHYCFLILYGVAGVSLLLLCIAMVYYVIIIQSLLLAPNFLALGLLVGIRPNPLNGRIPRYTKVTFCVAAFLSLVFIAITALLPFDILLSECPSIEPTSGHPYHRDGMVNQKYLTHLTLESVCQNEQGFIIGYLCYMALLFILNLVAIFVYAFRMIDDQ